MMLLEILVDDVIFGWCERGGFWWCFGGILSIWSVVCGRLLINVWFGSVDLV